MKILFKCKWQDHSVTHPLLQEGTATRKEGTWKRFAQSSLQESTTIRKEGRKKGK